MKTAVVVVDDARRGVPGKRLAAKLRSLLPAQFTIVLTHTIPPDPRRIAPNLVAEGTECVVTVSNGTRDLSPFTAELARLSQVDDMNFEAIPAASVSTVLHGPMPLETLALLAAATASSATDYRPLGKDARHVIDVRRVREASETEPARSYVVPVTVTVPVVSEEKCQAARGCTTCRDACPVNAIATNGTARVSKETCVSCGICVAACPSGALELSGSTEGSLLRRIEFLLQSTQRDGPLLLVGSPAALASVTGDRDRERLRRLVLPLEVPCAAAVSPGLMLASLRRGACGMVLVACPRTEPCSASISRAAESAVAVNEIVKRAGQIGDSVRVIGPTEPARGLWMDLWSIVDLFPVVPIVFPAYVGAEAFPIDFRKEAREILNARGADSKGGW